MAGTLSNLKILNISGSFYGSHFQNHEHSMHGITSFNKTTAISQTRPGNKIQPEQVTQPDTLYSIMNATFFVNKRS